jgi:hypothetical protein
MPSEVSLPWPTVEKPHHGKMDRIAFGGEAAVRFGHDRVAGVSNPDWFSMTRVSAFAVARILPRVQVLTEASWDKVTDDLVVERAQIDLRIRERLIAHAGILLPPLGRSNREHDAPHGQFTEPSLVASELVGVPSPQVGLGVRGIGRTRTSLVLSYELDLVTGYDGGLIDDSPDGTRLPRGRNGFGDNNGAWALTGRVAAHSGRDTELGLGALGGSYNSTELGGVTVDESRFVYVAVADGLVKLFGLSLKGESGLALVDVPPGLAGLFAEQQWAGSLEAARNLREPLWRRWSSPAIALALRADAVDFDRAIPGDSRSRLAASLNLRPSLWAVFRMGWYYEIRRDRFNNDVPAAGAALSVASYL